MNADVSWTEAKHSEPIEFTADFIQARGGNRERTVRRLFLTNPKLALVMQARVREEASR